MWCHKELKIFVLVRQEKWAIEDFHCNKVKLKGESRKVNKLKMLLSLVPNCRVGGVIAGVGW